MTAKKETPRDFRRKIKRAEESRNLWKDKHQEVQYKLKKDRAITDAAKRSRNEWRDKYDHTSSMTMEFKRNLEELQEKNKTLKKDNKILQENNKLLHEEIESQRKLMELKKNSNDLDWSLRAHSHLYSSKLIYLCILLVTVGAISFRGVTAILKILKMFFSQIQRVPAFKTVRQWVIRCGLYKLNVLQERFHDWAVILDHTIQIGQLKVLIVLGVRLSRLPEGRALSLGDVQPLLVLPMTSSTGNRINQVLNSIQEKYGSIRLIVADQGSDIKAGVKIFMSENSGVDYVPDIVHKLAHLLHYELSNNPSWQFLSKKTSVSRTKLLQSRYAHLIPPQKRDKARYLNLEELIKWSMRILVSFESSDISKEDQEAIKEHFSWVQEIKTDIKFFDELWRLVATTRDLIRTEGITSNTAEELGSLLGQLSLSERAKKIAIKVLDFVIEQSSKAEYNERLLGSSEIIESLIGTLKQRLNSQSRSGFTASVLMASTLAGEVSMSMTHAAMEEISAREVLEWSAAFIEDTIQKKRRIFQDLTKNTSECCKQENGTESGNFYTEGLLLETG